MKIIEQWRMFLNNDWISKLELALILLFCLIAAMWGLSQPGSESISAPEPDINIQAYAYSMPDKGWAPLKVYFSAFGTLDTQGEIIRYEWDLDGNGSFETDATANEGYASYVYTKPRTYTISLRVTNSAGGSTIAQTEVTVKHPAASSVDYWTVFDDRRVRKIEVQLTQENWDAMMENPRCKTDGSSRCGDFW